MHTWQLTHIPTSLPPTVMLSNGERLASTTMVLLCVSLPLLPFITSCCLPPTHTGSETARSCQAAGLVHGWHLPRISCTLFVTLCTSQPWWHLTALWTQERGDLEAMEEALESVGPGVAVEVDEVCMVAPLSLTPALLPATHTPSPTLLQAGQSSMHHAAMGGHVQALEWLAIHGAMPDIQATDKVTRQCTNALLHTLAHTLTITTPSLSSERAHAAAASCWRRPCGCHEVAGPQWSGRECHNPRSCMCLRYDAPPHSHCCYHLTPTQHAARPLANARRGSWWLC